MDNPGTSLFHGPEIKINNSDNHEEEEDLEDQKRRKEELQNLLTAALDDFNYDESTVNSSTNISVTSQDDVQNTYKQASQPDEQWRLLYDIRLKEINNLKEEYNNYKAEKSKELNALKNKLFVYEAEMRQLKISQKNSEELLVEKTNVISELNAALNSKDKQLIECEKAIENFKFEASTYQSTINELQFKLQESNAPYHLGSKRFTSEELQRVHQEEIIKLQTQINDQIKFNKITEKEKTELRQDLQNLLEEKNRVEKENREAIDFLTKTLEDAQQQCSDLINVVEMLTTENRHMQERLNLSAKESCPDAEYLDQMDVNTLLKQVEKLKKMLLDKSIQIDTLNSKLRHYEDDMKQLLEYRQLKSDVYKKEFQQCDNKEHTKSLLLMQNDLQNYRRTIEDNKQQILTLNSTNRDLQEKIEQMLLQTRNDIQNLSHKYSLPQLEQMTRELKNAEEKVKDLQERLQKSEEIRASLIDNLQENEKRIETELRREFENQLTNLQNSTEKDILRLQKDIDIFTAEIKSLKEFNNKLIDENTKLKLDLKEHSKMSKSAPDCQEISDSNVIKREYDGLKKQLDQVMIHLEKTTNQKEAPLVIGNLKVDMDGFLESCEKGVLQNNLNIQSITEKINHWRQQLDTMKFLSSVDEETVKKLEKAERKIRTLEEALEDMTSAKTIAEGEKCSLEFQIKDCENQLEHACKTIKYLENEIESMTTKLEEREGILGELEKKSTIKELDQLREQLNIKENALKICEKDKEELNELLLNVKFQLEESKKEALRMQKEITEVNERSVRRNLEKELKEAENHLEQSRIEEGDVVESEHFKNCLQAEILKNELKLREDLQQEYVRKTKEIEVKYQKACSSTTELYQEQMDKMKNQESRYREHLSGLLDECARKINEFEIEKQELINQIKYLHAEYEDYKKNVAAERKNYKQLIKAVQTEAGRNVEEWKMWSKQFVSNCLKIESINKTSRDNILLGMKSVDSEIAAIEKSYKDKLKKYVKSGKKDKETIYN